MTASFALVLLAFAAAASAKLFSEDATHQKVIFF